MGSYLRCAARRIEIIRRNMIYYIIVYRGLGLGLVVLISGVLRGAYKVLVVT